MCGRRKEGEGVEVADLWLSVGGSSDAVASGPDDGPFLLKPQP